MKKRINNDVATVIDPKNVDQVALAESVSEYIKYTPVKDLLVKPLAPIMIKRVFEVPCELKKSKKENIIDYKDTKKEEREVESTFKEGIIIKVPANMVDQFKVGQTVVYNGKFAYDFDLVKDSQLIKPYDVVAIKYPKTDASN